MTPPLIQGDSPEPLTHELRAATRALHEALDRSLAIEPSRATRGAYVAFLRASLTATEPLEQALAALGGFPASDRAARIRADLVELGVEPSPIAGVTVRPPASTAEGVGCSYVVEGLTFDGAALAGVFDEVLHLEGRALRYLRFRGTEASAAWHSLVARLDAWGERASRRERSGARMGASHAFESYLEAYRWLPVTSAWPGARTATPGASSRAR